jgi:hypothetical protein
VPLGRESNVVDSRRISKCERDEKLRLGDKECSTYGYLDQEMGLSIQRVCTTVYSNAGPATCDRWKVSLMIH